MQCSQLRQLSEVRQLNDMKNNSTKRFANFHGVWLYVIADLRQSVHFLLFQFDIYFAAFFANKTKSYIYKWRKRRQQRYQGSDERRFLNLM